MNNKKNTKNKTLAIPADAAAIPVKPSKPAMIEIIINMIAHFNMLILQQWLFNKYSLFGTN